METQVMKLSDMRSVDTLVERLERLTRGCRSLKAEGTQVHRIQTIGIDRTGVNVASFGSESARALAAAAVVLLERAMEIEHGHLTEQLKALGVEPDTEKTQLNPSPSNTEGK